MDLPAADVHNARTPNVDRTRKLSSTTRQRYGVRTRPHSRHVTSILPVDLTDKDAWTLFGCSCMDEDELLRTRSAAVQRARDHLHSRWIPTRVTRTVASREQRVAQDWFTRADVARQSDAHTPQHAWNERAMRIMTDAKRRVEDGQHSVMIARYLDA